MKVENNVLVSVNDSDLTNATLTLPEGITSIGDGAFRGCNSLATLTLPEGITSIGDGAFRGCNSLATLTLPEGITSIGDWAFDGCNSLATLTLPEGITSIGDGAFRGCNSLATLTLPEGITCELSPSQKDKILNDALSNIRNSTSGLCSILDSAITNAIGSNIFGTEHYLPEFNQQNAIENFGGSSNSYWWDESDRESRVRFVQALMASK